MPASLAPPKMWTDSSLPLSASGSLLYRGVVVFPWFQQHNPSAVTMSVVNVSIGSVILQETEFSQADNLFTVDHTMVNLVPE